ncbi:SDR family NAD(P)-dependent oxidoreductase [Saccharopolyspora sp. K220]|uniref:SDR family NAD(P)-dependent oxidoreductase n=1 Tax=Saccharopolyspora soli TaxID=2926618 RepID=UPI001F5A3100|nr:SDR family NAD(P)-dependent oxidoreductase [Saccharopolyspora soli]MCI2419752.1 SDR family NAD(P)-dependent oxidoreductase [Saccharopolyspora soli]
MTGASRGFGRIAAEKILRDHPEIHLVVTARGSGQQLVGDLARATANANVSAVSCDLASMRSIRSAAAELRKGLRSGALPPLCGFVGNAGLQMTSRTHASGDGIETTFAVNVLANYLLVRLLWEEFTAPARIVIVGSDTHFGDLRHNMGMVPAPRWESAPTLARPRDDAAARTAAEGRTAYSTSKLAVIYMVHALARRLPQGVDVHTFNPGYVPGTGLVRDASPFVRFLSRTLLHALTATPLALSPAAAGALLARAATGPRPGGSGTYIDRRAVDDSSPESYDRDREDELWHTAAALCGLPVELGHVG